MTKKPSGIDERPEQFRRPVVKEEGVTDSERYLAKLSDASFLNLWSYPSPYRDQKLGGKGDGKELCDLLVVCDRHVIIFSEKTIEWPSGDTNTAWCRWAKRALHSSSKQARGAERWIKEFPERIFLDRECTEIFPIDLPQQEDCIFHKVLVARGAKQACENYHGDGANSMSIKPCLVGNVHWSNQQKDVHPFAIGDLEPSGSFVHVFDEVGLDVVLGELDTISDFTDYLEKRRAFIRSGDLFEAHGEENLLAFYATRTNSDDDHDFVLDGETTPITIGRDQYQKLIGDQRYKAKMQANRISYLWDVLIKQFTDRMLDGTSIKLDNFGFELRKNELGVRYMALQDRLSRRALGEGLSCFRCTDSR